MFFKINKAAFKLFNSIKLPFLFAVFLEVISDVTVAANGPPASMTCVAKAHNLYWRVNNTWYTHKHTDPLIRKGFAFSARYNATIAVVSGNVTISVSGEHRTNNNTVVKCRADRQPNDNTSISAVATLLIAGKHFY